MEPCCCGRVIRRELVDDEHVAAGPGHPSELGNDPLGSRDVMERAMRAGEVEGGVQKRQRRPVSLDELRVRPGARPSTNTTNLQLYPPEPGQQAFYSVSALAGTCIGRFAVHLKLAKNMGG